MVILVGGIDGLGGIERASSGISDVAFTLLHSEKTCLKKLMVIIITSNRKTTYW